MRYSVIRHFTDLLDGNRKYKEGDIYPRDGYEPTAERIEELSTDKNKLKTSLIVPEFIPMNDEEPEHEELAEAAAEVVAEDSADEDVPDNDDVDIEEKPKKRTKKKSDE